MDSEQVRKIRQIAQKDIQDVIQSRTDRRFQFDARDGWRLCIETSAPLWPHGFDPLNVSVIDGGILHTRFLRLANDSCGVEMLDGSGADLEALTVAAGPHPLFSGIARITIAGLTKPDVKIEGSRTRLSAPGLQADIWSGKISLDETRKWIHVTVRP